MDVGTLVILSIIILIAYGVGTWDEWKK